MKKNLTKLTLTVLLISCLAMFVNAQNSVSKQQIKVRVEREIDGRKTVQEKTIDASSMTEAERQATIDSLQNAMMGENYTGKRVKVIIEETDKARSRENEDRFEFQEDGQPSGYSDNFDENNLNYRFKSSKPKVIIKKRHFGNNDFDWDSEAWEKDFERSMNNLNNRLQYLGDEIPRRIENGVPFYRFDNRLFDGKSAPIKSVVVYPNQPDSHVINVRFYTPNEGNVSIKIIDIDGETAAQETIKNFQGEYVGQLKLRQNSSGTYFVMITQNNDGITKRFILE